MEGGQPETIVSPSYHTGDYHLSLCTHDSFILFHELCSHRFPYHFVVPDLGPQAGLIALYRYYLILRESRYCREQQTAYSFPRAYRSGPGQSQCRLNSVKSDSNLSLFDRYLALFKWLFKRI